MRGPSWRTSSEAPVSHLPSACHCGKNHHLGNGAGLQPPCLLSMCIGMKDLDDSNSEFDLFIQRNVSAHFVENDVKLGSRFMGKVPHRPIFPREDHAQCLGLTL
jgi:hypothetical protein